MLCNVSHVIIQRLIAFASAFLFFCTIPLTAYGIGFTRIEAGQLEIGVWYPSDTAPRQGKLGPFEVQYAFDAPLAGDNLEMILLSHGRGGKFRNHHLTASTLANMGYIVIAPNHRVDHLIGGSKTAQAMQYRARELQASFEILRKSYQFSAHLKDNASIHAIGYSLGSVTVLMAASAPLDLSVTQTHCKQNYTSDKNFCKTPWAIQRWVQSWRNPIILSTGEDFSPFITGDIALIAPLGQFFSMEARADIQARRIMVAAFTDDEIAKPDFHAKYLAQIFAQAKPFYFHDYDAHHFAFIAPFPDWLKAKKQVKVAQDPAGFDRLELIHNVNRDIINFLR